MLQYVDGLTAIRFVAATAAEDTSPEESIRQTAAVALRTEVVACIKGGNNLDLKTLHTMITEATLKSISVDLLRRCIAFMLWNDQICRKRGFVLDVWSTGPGAVISSSKDVSLLFSNFSYNSNSKSFTAIEADNLILDIVIELVVIL